MKTKLRIRLTSVWNDLSISRKLLLILSIVLILPILSLGLFLSQSLSDSYRANSERSGHAVVRMLGVDLDARFKVYIDNMVSVATNPRVVDFLSTDFPDAYAWNIAFKSDMDMFLRTPENIERKLDFRILTSRRSTQYSRIFLADLAETGVEGLTEQIWTETLQVRWDGIVLSDGKAQLVAHTPIKNRSIPYDTVAVLFSYIDVEALSSLFQFDETQTGFLALTDASGGIILTNASELPDAGLSQISDRGEVEIDGERYLLLADPLELPTSVNSSWTIYYGIPLKPLEKQIAGIWTTTLALTVVTMLLALAIIRRFSAHLTRRVSEIIESMDALHGGDISVRIPAPAKDEFGRISSYFNEMADRIDRYVNEILLNKIALQKKENENVRIAQSQTEARLLYLQSQINPHYLFNTLESIRMKILINGDRETAKVIRIFSNGFREMVESHGQMVPLQQELDLVKNFFLIQNFRYGDRLEYRIDCDADLTTARLPLLLIQPVVENAIYHGIDPSGRKGFVHVHVYTADLGGIGIIVSDNGIGMDSDELEVLLMKIRSEDSQEGALALRNIHLRLKLLYQDDFDFDIRSGKEQGMSVMIRLPGRIS